MIFPYKEFEASSGAGSIALFYQKSLVVTNVGGLPDLVKDKNVIAKSNDSIDLADKIEYALKNRIKLEKDSKEVAKRFSWKKIAEKTMGIYNEKVN